MHTVTGIAHRGYSAQAPENTLTAFKQAMESRAPMIECDVRSTVDDHIVVMHDATVDRTTNGIGTVEEMSLWDIRALDAGAWFGQDFAGEKVPTLEETLDLCRGKAKLIVEIKEPGIEDTVVDMITAHEMDDEVVIASFHECIGLRMPELNESIGFCRLVYATDPIGEEAAVRMADETAGINSSILGINYKAITAPLIKATHAANMQIMAWTVDAEADMRALAELGVDMIASNRIALLLSVLSDAG